jgi:outer membrane receptor protein involved in Fe transport
VPPPAGRKPRRAAGLIVLSGLLCAQARAEEPRESERPRMQEESVLIGTLRRTALFDLTRAASVVERDELRARPPRTTAEVLNDEEGVFLQRPMSLTLLFIVLSVLILPRVVSWWQGRKAAARAV